MNNKEQKLLEMYAKKNLGSVDAEPLNPCCQECHKTFRGKLSKPLSAWCVGDEFDKQEKRILFVGKIAIGEMGEEFLYPDYPNDETNPTHYCMDVFDYARENLGVNYKTAFWNFILDISQKVFPHVKAEQLLEYIAITNLIKCNNGKSKAAITEFMRFNCIDYLDVVRREIDIIEPTHVIFTTGASFDENLTSIFDDIENEQCIEDSYHNRWCGLGSLGSIGHKIPFLRVRHPQFAGAGLADTVQTWLDTGKLV